MKKTEKVLLFVVSLIGIGFSVCISSSFYPIPLITKVIKSSPVLDTWLNYIFAGYNIFIGLCFFVLLLFSVFFPSRSNFLTIEKNNGKLIFSKKTVESVAHYSFNDLDGIISSEVRAKFNRHPDKTKIYVKLSINNATELIDLTETVQNKIESALQSSLNITVKSITIKVVRLSSSEIAKDSRVA